MHDKKYRQQNNRNNLSLRHNYGSDLNNEKASFNLNNKSNIIKYNNKIDHEKKNNYNNKNK